MRQKEPQRLKLPDNVMHLVEAVNACEALRDILTATQTQVGGGSVLAAHWGGHRRSTDIDLMMPENAFITHRDAVWEALKSILATEYRRIHGEDRDTIIVLGARNVGGVEGDIEVVKDSLGDQLRRQYRTHDGPILTGLPLTSEAKSYIIAKKFYRMRREHLERDHYDVLWAAYRNRTTLFDTVIRHVDPEIVQDIAMQAQRPAEELFASPHKPVRDPKAPAWKSVLAEVWQAIDTFTTDPGKRNIALPVLKGAGGGKRWRYHGE